MLRRFLTAFALITGLAALGAPAHAVENVAERLELGAQVEETSAAEAQPFELAANDSIAAEPAFLANWSIQLQAAEVLTIYYGIDRARD